MRSFELAAELGARHERSEVEREKPLPLDPLRHLTVDDALGEAFDDRGLADAGFSDSAPGLFLVRRCST